MNTTTVSVPGGFVDGDEVYKEVTIREMKEGEETLLSSKKVDFNKIVERCIVSIGPVSDKETLDRLKKEMYKVDSDYLLVEIRKLSLGEMYEFRISCPSCKKEDAHEMNLDELDLNDMEDPAEKTFSFTTSGDKEIIFRHTLASDTSTLSDISESSDNILGKQLAMHLISVGGKTPEDYAKGRHRKITTPAQRVKAGVGLLKEADISYGEREKIRMKMRKLRGGLDTVLETMCEHCGASWKHRLPLDANFIMPSARMD